MWTKRSDPVLHIVFRRWADLLVIGPLDANTLGKIASGICNNLLVGHVFITLLWHFIWICFDTSLSKYVYPNLLMTDMCGADLGPQPSSAFLSCYEHNHVAAPYHCTASSHT